ncbi:hypothetical protein K438DRAFT_1775316 [Mycena galopus ATCC 62051]|nr:hypothetical protein K438DRAFT_1775316 [Mycena galopus ATCC 62051]
MILLPANVLSTPLLCLLLSHAQNVGDRNCARWGLKAPKMQKCCAPFWELFITDCWQALVTGRLPYHSLIASYHGMWTRHWARMGHQSHHCSLILEGPIWAQMRLRVVQGTVTSRTLKYFIILELDRKIRDIELPKYTTGSPLEGVGLSKKMSHFMKKICQHLTTTLNKAKTKWLSLISPTSPNNPKWLKLNLKHLSSTKSSLPSDDEGDNRDKGVYNLSSKNRGPSWWDCVRWKTMIQVEPNSEEEPIEFAVQQAAHMCMGQFFANAFRPLASLFASVASGATATTDTNMSVTNSSPSLPDVTEQVAPFSWFIEPQGRVLLHGRSSEHFGSGSKPPAL